MVFLACVHQALFLALSLALCLWEVHEMLTNFNLVGRLTLTINYRFATYLKYSEAERN